MRMLLKDLSPGTKYYLQARTFSDSEGAKSEWSRKFEVDTPVDTMAPQAPASPVITLSGTEGILSWSPVTTNADGSPITDLAGYKVTVKSPGTSNTYVKNVGLATNMEFSLDTNRKAFGSPRGQLYFDVVAIDSVGNESSVSTSPTVSTPPPANVTGLSSSGLQSAISLTWDALTSPLVVGYKVYMGTTAGFALDTPVAEVKTNAHIQSTTMYSTDHYFKVVAVDAFGVVSAVPASTGPIRPTSPFALDTTAPAVPTGLTAVISNNTMKVSWNAVSDTDLRYYIVSYRPAGTTEWATTNVPHDQTSTVIPVATGVNYNVRVRTSDVMSNMSNESSIITTTTAVVNTAPAVPTGLAVVAGKDNLQISWNENTEADMKNNLGTYDVTVATNSGFTTGVLQYRTGATTLSINGLSTATQYWVRVRATDSGNPPLSSAYSASVTATTSSFPTTPLSDGVAPASSPVASVTGGFRYIHASWTPIANNDTVTYEVHLGTTTGFTPSASTKVGEIAGSTIIIETTGAGASLAYDTNYYVKTIAKDRDGAAAASAASSAVQITKVASTDTTITPGQIGAATPSDVQGAKDYTDTKYSSALKGSVVEYAVNSSESTAPTTGWSSSTPTRTPGTFVWFRTVLTYGDNTTTTTSPALLTGNTGATGSTGAPAQYITLTATTQVLSSPSAGGTTNPATSVVTGTATNTTISVWEYSVNGAAFSATVPAGVTRSGNVVTITGATMTAKTITVRMTNGSTASDTITVARVFDGADGAAGAPGPKGDTGSTGAAGADAYTVLLTNEAQTFAGSTTAALAGSASTAVIAYKGATQTAATIGTVTGQVTGLTTAITNNGTNNATVTVTVTTALTALSGVLTIPVTVDGKTFTKTFSWSVSRQGVQGSQGIPGAPGADGQVFYTWLKYADTPTTGMSDLPDGKTYMGIAYNKTTETESSNYADYTWSLIKGADGSPGVPGAPGADGTTTYTWVKYATSAAGAGMSDDPTGKTYIGLAFNKTTAIESTTPGDYQWSLIQGPQGETGNTGAPGAPAEMVYLTSTTQVLTSPAAGGATNPTTAVVTGASVNGTITVWQYSTNGAAFINTLPTGVTRSGNVVTITGSTMAANTITVRMATASGVSDTLTVAKVYDGATGATGTPGAPGADGSDAYTVILSNEAHSFAGSTTAALAGSTTSTVIAYKGATQQSATVGTITGQVTGLTTSIASNSTTAPVITITVTTALTTRNGTLTVPVTVDGKTFTKTIAWSVAYTGATGSTGAPGANGVSVTSVTPYYQTVTKGAAAPAVPTTMTPPGPWSATEPSYTTNTELYRTDRVVYSNSTFSYSPVTKVASYSGLEAVTADAQVKADAARDAAILAAASDAATKAGAAQTAATDAAKSYTDSTKGALETEISNIKAQALAAAANATNLVANPSFEQDLEGWTQELSGSPFTVSTAQARTGSKSMLALKGTQAMLSTVVPVSPGQTFRLNAWYNAISANGVHGLRLQTSTNGTTWSNVTSGSAGGWTDGNIVNGGGWTEMTREYTVQSGVSYIRMRIATASHTSGSVYWDDLSIKDITESKRLEAFANDVESRALSRGTDLVTNGTGYLKSNYNFPSQDFNGADSPVGANGSFVARSTAQHSVVINELIPYDPTKSYRFSFQARQTVPGATNRLYGFISPYDADGFSIAPYHYAYQTGTTTTLTKELKPGDTTIEVASTAGWFYGTTTHLRSIIVWNYTDGSGKKWAPGTYSRLWSGSDVYSSFTSTVITLRNPWPANMGTHPVGTSISNGMSGGSYIYTPSADNTPVPEKWTAYADTLPAGLMSPTYSGAATWNTGLPVATASIKIGWLFNYPASPSNSTVGRHAVAGVSFSDAAAANYAANNITSTQITDGAISTPKIKTNAIDARTIATDAVTSNAILAGSVIAGKIATDAVDAAQIKANAITTVKLDTDAVDARVVKAGAIGTVALAAEAVDATKIKSNSITTRHMAIGDTSNMIEINESNLTGVTFAGGTHAIVNGWSTRDANTGTYFMFRNQTGPLPFKTGDRIRITFEAYADAAVTATLGLWTYGNATVSQSFGSPAITTSAQSFAYELTVTADTNLKTSYIIGMQGVAGRNVYVRNVRAYRMNAGELIVDGSIHGDKITANTINGDRIITNTLDANAIKTSTLTSTVITLGAGGIIKTNTGGVQITDSGIVIPAGHLDANTIKANTSFVTTINVGAGGSIQSTGYTSGGTSGFSLSSTGLTIKGANNVVDASVIKGGTITGTTVNVGAGGTLNIDSTAQVKSNNYAINSTGYRLSNTGLEINDGSIDAKTLRANSALINEIVIGETATGPGGIRSNDYVANSNGFKLSTAGLEVNKGSISAEALRLQIGRNQMHPAYADFEHDESFYAGKIANFFAIPMVSSEQAKFGSKSLKITWTGDSGSSVHLAASESDWNVKFDPSKKQIVSMWVFIPDSYSVRMIIRYNQTNGVRGNILTPLVPTGTGWQRISYEWTPPALATGDALVGIVNGAGSLSKSMYVDAVQFEEKTGASSEPSTYFPPSTTTIDGGAIRTGSIRSSALNSRGEPYWSINMSGNAVFNRALIQEELIVGDPSSASKYASIKSVNYTAGTSGWIIDSSGKFEANDGTFRGKIMASSLEASMNIAGSGVIISGTPTGARVEQSSQGIKVFALGYNNEPYEAVSMINGKTSFSVVNQTVGVAAGISSEGEVTGQTGSFKNNLYFKGVDMTGTLSGSPVTGWMDLLARGIVPGGLSTSTTLGTASSAETRGITVRGMVYAGRRYRVRGAWLGKLSAGSGVVRLRIRYTYDGSLPTTSSPVGGAAPTFSAYSSSVSVGGDVETILAPSSNGQLTVVLTHQGLTGATAQKEWSQIYIEDIGPKNLEFPENEDGSVKTLYTTSWKATQSKGYRKDGKEIPNKNNQIDLWYFGNSQAEQAIALFGGTATTTDNQSEVGRTMPQALNGATIHKVTLEITNAMWWDKNVRNMAFGSLAGSTLPAEQIVEGSKPVSNIAEGSTISVDLNASDFTNGTAQMVTIGNRNASVNGATMGSGRFQGPADASPPVLTVVYSR